ncbi:hypothetical protein HY745_10870 [Candidatus Desantisbacteria bacterium]|nr:hypothetical protein [Candidatus Desantisbacteria bacterium]
MMRAFIIVLMIIAFSVAVCAGEKVQQRKVSITISPFHLLSPVLHLTGELRITDKISAAAILGGGQVSEEGKNYDEWEAGYQFRYYLIGSFTHGLMLGADTGYIHVSGKLDSPMDYYVGVRAGVFAGYKIVTKRGFTFEVQIGPQYVRESASHTELQTLENLKIGWSF